MTSSGAEASASADVAWNHGGGGGGDDVVVCRSCVRKEMWNVVEYVECEGRAEEEKEYTAESSMDGVRKRKRLDDESAGAGAGAGDGGGNLKIIKKRESLRRGKDDIESVYDKSNLREEACLAIASFFYNNGIPFHVAKSEEFLKMCESVARHGVGFKPPSYHEIRGKYLKQQVERTRESLEEHRDVWKKSGCTIMIEGWTGRRKSGVLKLLVNSSKGTVFLKSVGISETAEEIFKVMDGVVEEVGEENVVQVVTENAESYKAAGDLLMQKRKKLYWTPCAAHCIELMLEDFEKKIPLHKETIASGKKITTYIYSRSGLVSLLHHFTKGKDLIRPAATRFATSYLTLGCLNDNKGALIRMFTSKAWKSSQLAKTRDGVSVENLIIDKKFWTSILNCLRSAYPLIRVLRLVESDERPAMGFIYKEMDQVKEKIQNAFKGNRRSYEPLWEIIDERWDNQLHRPLHAAGYYLNPILHYSPEFKSDFKVKRGLYDCLERMVGDIKEVGKIDVQLEDFKSRSKFFGRQVATLALKTKTPAQWWESYGAEHPELQRFAIQVSSLTCSSRGCGRNGSAFEMVHTKKRNRLKQKAMNDVVFVMANSRLTKKNQDWKANDFEDLSSDDDWIVENDQNSDLDLDAPSVPVGEEDDSGSCGFSGLR